MKIKSLLFVIAMSVFLPTAVWAGADAGQRALQERMQASQKKLEQAEQAKGAQREQMMKEHMKSMDENMKLMRDMSPPKSGMSAKDRDEWMTEHQKLMQMMMDQMKREHDLTMQIMPK
ncbi:MAG: hypothetical protein HY081_05765 [Gammaproteobacteria bacterium]|nr:hypothetical protein [Gammaproteobacteria bacterium]